MERKFLSKQERGQMDMMIKKHQKEALSIPIEERINSLGEVGISFGFKGLVLLVEDQDGKIYNQVFGSITRKEQKIEPTMTQKGTLKDEEITNN